MAPARAPLFLARRSYRLRRVMDALRLLPLFGLILFVLPAMFVVEPSQVARFGLYIFAVWGAVIAVTAYLSRRLDRALDPGEPLAEIRDD
ncbi:MULTISPECIES: hypothetical protein [Thioclava]|uniref:Solute:sodium symporter small subunit n=1 Tax=Thioclava litoralis TaxID=3076557 RepID=A0ABZ1DYJ0_9RHOB|nr:hypothetical protein RPE78_00860 [Thioclava sp. FTW29]